MNCRARRRSGLAPLTAALVLALAVSPAAADDFDSAGVKIHYTVEGKGEPVLLIHGLHASAKLNWGLPGVTAALAEKYQVIALDCRGHGESGKPEREEEYGLAMVEDVTRLLAHLKIEQAHIVGYSMGGMIALKFVAVHPERVRSVVLGGMGWLRSGGLLQRFWEHAGREGASAPEACMRGMAKLALTEEELAAVQRPVSVIVGTHDPVRRLYVEPLRQARPDWPVATVEGAGHLSCVAKPEFKEKLAAALARQAAADGEPAPKDAVPADGGAKPKP